MVVPPLTQRNAPGIAVCCRCRGLCRDCETGKKLVPFLLTQAEDIYVHAAGDPDIVFGVECPGIFGKCGLRADKGGCNRSVKLP